MSYTVQRTYTLAPTLVSLRPVPITLSPIPTTVTFETVIHEPKVEVKQVVEESYPVTITTQTTTTEVKEVKEVPRVTSTCLWSHGPVNFYEIQQLEKK